MWRRRDYYFPRVVESFSTAHTWVSINQSPSPCFSIARTPIIASSAPFLLASTTRTWPRRPRCACLRWLFKVHHRCPSVFRGDLTATAQSKSPLASFTGLGHLISINEALPKYIVAPHSDSGAKEAAISDLRQRSVSSCCASTRYRVLLHRSSGSEK